MTEMKCVRAHCVIFKKINKIKYLHYSGERLNGPSQFRVCVRAWLMLLVAFFSMTAPAQNYPSRPIRLVVPFSAGGGVDFVGRVTAQKLGAGLKQTVVVDNRAGAGGNIGTEIVAKAPPDGHTLLVVSSSFTLNPTIYKPVPYDPIKDFVSVSMLTSYMLFIVVHPTGPVRSIKSLLEVAKAKPGFLTYASAGGGTTTHVAGELLSYMAGIRLTHIPYKGTAPSLPAVIGGQVAMAFAAPSAVPHVKAGRLALIAVTGAKRSPIFPDAPTVAESGVPGYEAMGWNALFAPAGTPVTIVNRLSDVVGKGLKEADATTTFEKQGLDQSSGTPEALAAIVRAEVARWPNVVKTAGIAPVE